VAEALRRRAVIDIGTNSVKLLVADVVGDVVQPVWERGKQTRLGQGFYETHILRQNAIADTALAVAKFMEKAVSFQVPRDCIQVIATSAARDALNQQDLIEAIQQASGLKPRVISGEQEAEWAYRGVMTNPQFRGRRLLIMETGGGSMQLIMGNGHVPQFNQSYKLGVVRLLDRLKPGDPPTTGELAHCRAWLQNFCREHLEPALQPLLQSPAGASLIFVGSGGTVAVLARMERRSSDLSRAEIEEVCLPLSEVRHWVEYLWNRTLAERQHIIGLPKNRADVMLMGPAIYEAVMERLGFPEMRVSTRGLRFGAIIASEAPTNSASLSPAANRIPAVGTT